MKFRRLNVQPRVRFILKIVSTFNTFRHEYEETNDLFTNRVHYRYNSSMPRAQSNIAKSAAKTPKLPKITVHAKVTQDVVNKLDAIAERNGISRSAAAAIGLTRFVEKGI